MIIGLKNGLIVTKPGLLLVELNCLTGGGDGGDLTDKGTDEFVFEMGVVQADTVTVVNPALCRFPLALSLKKL